MNRTQFLGVFLFVGGLFLWGCEPLAPEAAPQVIIATNSTQIAPTGSPENLIPASPTPRPAPTITLTPTDIVIPTATVPPCDQTEGRILAQELTSLISPDPIPYNIYLPPCFFESGRRYPLLLLLHGSGYTYEQWIELGIQSVYEAGLNAQPPTFAPMVIVMPEGGVYQENNVFEAGRSYEDILLGELLPELERTYCVQTSARGRAIGGISRGGFWAYSIGFRHPEVFGAVGGHSPWFVPDNAPATHNPLALAERATNLETLRLYLDNAQNDDGGANVIVFSNLLRGRAIQHIYIIHPVGGHNNDYWSSHLAEYLAFYSQSFPAQVGELPSCQ